MIHFEQYIFFFFIEIIFLNHFSAHIPKNEYINLQEELTLAWICNCCEIQLDFFKLSVTFIVDYYIHRLPTLYKLWWLTSDKLLVRKIHFYVVVNILTLKYYFKYIDAEARILYSGQVSLIFPGWFNFFLHTLFL